MLRALMDRTERLLDLVALLLDAKEPVSWAELREAFPSDYGQGSEEATERKFERDKAELLELGIPLLYVQGDEDRRDGYVLPRDAYYLPEVDFTPEELAVLYAAGSAALSSGAFPGQQDLAHALRKIAFFSEGALTPPRFRMELGGQEAGPELAGRLEALWGAASTHKKVELVYQSPREERKTTARTVRPYGLALRRGIWSLVGFCELRGDIRTFHVHRIRDLRVNALRPRTPDFEVPAQFRLDDWVARYPWQHRIHAPMEVTLSLSGELASMGARLFPTGRVVEETPERTQVALTVNYLDGLLRAVLSLAPDGHILSPPEAVTRFREMAQRALSRHVGQEAA
jgi:proteasome accessory factor B